MIIIIIIIFLMGGRGGGQFILNVCVRECACFVRHLDLCVWIMLYFILVCGAVNLNYVFHVLD